MNPREKLLAMLKAMVDRLVSPSDVIASTGLPRYEVLAAFHVFEALGIVKRVYSRGNYRLYQLTEEGVKLLKALEKKGDIKIDVEEVSIEAQEGEATISVEA
ncbi:MAG: hypothetical protein DRO12_02995 [Thermoprotei archaeon]|nr:MAG: hypothetical protein DRO12_02995 [Thermoprotei archaeon]